MFGRKKTAVMVAEPVAPPKPPKPNRVVNVALEGASLREYAQLAERVGAQGNQALRMAQLFNYLQREEIPVYHYGKVSDFLDELQYAERKRRRNNDLCWAWQPIRPGYDTDFNEQSYRVGDTVTTRRVYKQAIPFQALKRIEVVQRTFHNAAFFVSALNQPKPDPFLMVMLKPGWQRVVIAHWDEPGFKVTAE